MRFKIIICARNAEPYIDACLRHVEMQTLADQMDVCVTDDGSTDRTTEIAQEYCQRNGWLFFRNEERAGILYNQYRAINALYTGDEDDVIVILDGDYRFTSEFVLHILNEVYADDTQVTYGTLGDTDSFPATPYPYGVRRENAFRWFTTQHNVYFNHLRTCRYRIFHGMEDQDFKYDDGRWFRDVGDAAMILPWMELANGRVKFIPEELCLYTPDHPNSASRVHPQTTHEECVIIQSRRPKDPLPEFQEWKEPSAPPELKNVALEQHRHANGILHFARFYNVHSFVETGTSDGFTTMCLVGGIPPDYTSQPVHEWARADFDQIFTIEINPTAFQNAQRRLRHYAQVKQFLGDSSEHMRWIVAKVSRPTLFWLDAHYCGGYRGQKDSPIEEELEAIFASPMEHIILIDDADLFQGMPRYEENSYDWPHIDSIKQVAAANDYEFFYDQQDASVRLIPKKWIEEKGVFEWRP